MVTRGIPRSLLPLLGVLHSGRAQGVKRLGTGTRHLGVARRAFCSTPSLKDSSATSGAPEKKVTVHFMNRDGERLTATATEGDSLLDVVMKQNLDIEGFGACEGTLGCSTCHLIFNQDVYDQLDDVTDEEMDMLDLAYGLTNTSRLGCQVCLTKAMDGLTVRVPTSMSDARTEEMEQKRKQ